MIAYSLFFFFFFLQSVLGSSPRLYDIGPVEATVPPRTPLEYCKQEKHCYQLLVHGSESSAFIILRVLTPPQSLSLFILTLIHCRDHPIIPGNHIVGMTHEFQASVNEDVVINPCQASNEV